MRVWGVVDLGLCEGYKLRINLRTPGWGVKYCPFMGRSTTIGRGGYGLYPMARVNGRSNGRSSQGVGERPFTLSYGSRPVKLTGRHGYFLK